MSKRNITRLFVAGLITFIVGAVIDFIAIVMTFAGGVIVLGGPNFVQVNGGPNAWLVVTLVSIGSLLVLIGGIAGLISWIGALLNTAQLDDKTWFLLILLLGLVSFGFMAMVAYVLAGPDSTTTRLPQPAASGAQT
jgi:hypothetical protein